MEKHSDKPIESNIEIRDAEPFALGDILPRPRFEQHQKRQVKLQKIRLDQDEFNLYIVVELQDTQTTMVSKIRKMIQGFRERFRYTHSVTSSLYAARKMAQPITLNFDIFKGNKNHILAVFREEPSGSFIYDEEATDVWNKLKSKFPEKITNKVQNFVNSGRIEGEEDFDPEHARGEVGKKTEEDVEVKE